MADPLKNEEIEDEVQDELEIEIIDDTPEEDRGRKAKVEEDDDDDDDDDAKEDKDDDDEDEAKQYSAAVQKRIKKLRYDYHEERRAKEEAKRLSDEAIAQAKRATDELTQLRKKFNEGEAVLYQQAEGRVDAQINEIKRKAKDAYDAGESEAFVEAQAELSKLVNEKSRIEGFKSRPKPQEQSVLQAPETKPKINAPSERALEWSKENEWFNTDRKMTAFAYGVHEDIVTSGIKPDTKEYYRQIDKEMRKTFPDKFDDVGKEAKPSRETGTVVAAPSRTSGKKPRTMRLTQSQVTLAKRLGLTNQQYAAQLLKDQENDG